MLKNEVKKIRKVKCLGVRTGEETRVLATYNSAVYCMLVEYSDGSRELIEGEAKSKDIKKLLQYIDMN